MNKTRWDRSFFFSGRARGYFIFLIEVFSISVLTDKNFAPNGEEQVDLA